MPLSSSFSWLSLISKHHHPHLQQSNVIPALLDENEDSIDFVHVCITVMEALVLCCSGGQLITLVWGLVMGHHQPALCCCQEPFTPSISSPNGTSKSIKTIITANSTESKEIIFRSSKKTWLRCLNLSVQGAAWCALSQTTYYSLDLLYLSCVNTLMTPAGFFQRWKPIASQWTGCCLTMQMLQFELSWWAGELV